LIEDGTKKVCDACWGNPNLFFAEKVKNDEKYKFLLANAEKTRSRERFIKISVVKFIQKNIEMYIGKIKSQDLLKLYEIDRFDDKELDGYQREQYEERTSELIEYLVDCPIAVMPSLFVSVRNARFISHQGDFGTLEIYRQKGSIWIIDGQHRVGGFQRIFENFTYNKNFNKELTSENLNDIMEYELPIVFIDTEKIARGVTTLNNNASPEELERVIFYIVNKTQKGISSSLKDALLYKINLSGINGIPALRKDKWRISAAHIAIVLNKEIDSPLVGMINVAGKTQTKKPIQLNSFVSSLEPLLKNYKFAVLGSEEQVRFVKTYWSVLRSLFPSEFEQTNWKTNILMKSVGIYCINKLSCDIFELVCNTSDINYEIIAKTLKPLSRFDWSSDKSPLSNLGGMKGANTGYEKLKTIVFGKEKS